MSSKIAHRNAPPGSMVMKIIVSESHNGKLSLLRLDTSLHDGQYSVR